MIIRAVVCYVSCGSITGNGRLTDGLWWKGFNVWRYGGRKGLDDGLMDVEQRGREPSDWFKIHGVRLQPCAQEHMDACTPYSVEFTPYIL